jgi:outer membrane biogenesis lipoprotein LolB
MRTNFILILLVCSALLNSCTNENTSPDPTSQITNKWWCAKAGTGTISSQYFKADGTWEQGSKGGRFNDTGKWALSVNKKKIVISSVLDYNKKSKTGWEYDMETFSETSLKMNWNAFGVIMDLEVCK